MVYVLDQSGNPLMPTNRHAKVRKMLKDGRAVVKIGKPFTIQLKYEPETHITQEMVMGIDIGPESCGVSVVRFPKREYSRETARSLPVRGTEVFAAEVVPRKDISAIQKQTREFKQNRRKRNKRRKKHTIKKGQKKYKRQLFSVSEIYRYRTIIDSIIRILEILPVGRIVLEDGEFGTKHTMNERIMKNPEGWYSRYVKSTEYQRSIVLTRDNHVCQCCFGRSKDKILTTKNIIDYYKSEKDKARDVDGLGPYITLCQTCRKRIESLWKKHKKDPKNPKKSEKYYKLIDGIRKRHEEFVLKNNALTKMENRLQEKVHSKYDGEIIHTFKEYIRIGIQRKIISEKPKFTNVKKLDTIDGITIREIRHRLNLSNTPIINARVIATLDSGKYPNISSESFYYRYRKYRSRSLHKVTPKKGGIRPPRSPMIVKGFSAYDEVRYLGKKHPELYGKTFFITKKRKTGYFSIGRLDGTTILNSVKYSDLKLITKRKAYSVERR